MAKFATTLALVLLAISFVASAPVPAPRLPAGAIGNAKSTSNVSSSSSVSVSGDTAIVNGKAIKINPGDKVSSKTVNGKTTVTVNGQEVQVRSAKSAANVSSSSSSSSVKVSGDTAIVNGKAIKINPGDKVSSKTVNGKTTVTVNGQEVQVRSDENNEDEE